MATSFLLLPSLVLCHVQTNMQIELSFPFSVVSGNLGNLMVNEIAKFGFLFVLSCAMSSRIAHTSDKSGGFGGGNYGESTTMLDGVQQAFSPPLQWVIADDACSWPFSCSPL